MTKKEATGLIKSIFPSADRITHWIDKKCKKPYEYTCCRVIGGVTFDKLAELGKLFNTTKINISSDYEQGCPTCGGTYYTEIDITKYL
jgi:hypothetical protein